MLKSTRLVIVCNSGSAVGQPAAQRQPETRGQQPAPPSSPQDADACDGAGLDGARALGATMLYPARAEAVEAPPVLRSAAVQRLRKQQHLRVHCEALELSEQCQGWHAMQIHPPMPVDILLPLFRTVRCARACRPLPMPIFQRLQP